MLIGEIGKNASFDLIKLGKNFAAAQEFLLAGGLASLPVGNHAIVGDDVFVMMQEYTQQEEDRKCHKDRDVITVAVSVCYFPDPADQAFCHEKNAPCKNDSIDDAAY